MGDCDDVLHFTTKTDEGAQEVIWFLTPMVGTATNQDGSANTETRYRLHRRELKINPSLPTSTKSLSLGYTEAKADGSIADPERAANSLESLSMRYNRNAHKYTENGQFEANTAQDYNTSLESEFIDESGNDRTDKTVILENVIAFDVQAYDPAVPIYSDESDGQTVPVLPSDPGYPAASAGTPISAGAFRDLNYLDSSGSSPLQPDAVNTATYDSWSGDYVKQYEDPATGKMVPGEVGFDNFPLDENDAPMGDGIVDTAEDLREVPPYDVPLRAVQVEIRVQEPKSGKVRSVKVRKFLGKR